MVVQAVFLDIDGSLVDSNEFHVRALEEAFLKAAFPITRPQIRKQIGKGAAMLIPTRLPGSDASTRQGIAATRGKRFKTCYLSQVRAFPGAASQVRELQAQGRRPEAQSGARSALKPGLHC